MQEQKKKLLITTGIFPPDIGGPATYTSTLLKKLPEYGYDIKIITYSSVIPAKAGIQENLVHRIKRRQNILTRYFQFFWQVFKEAKTRDIIYTQGPISEGLPTYLACKLRGKKYLLKITGDQAWERYSQNNQKQITPDEFQENKYNLKTEILRFIQKIVAKNAKLIITPSQYLKKIVKKWGISEDKIKVIYNSVKEINILETKDELRQKLNLSGDVILSAGRLLKLKQFDKLIELMSELLKVNPNFKLLIIGSGEELENLQSKISQNNFQNYVYLLGEKKQEELWRYIKASDIFVLNSIHETMSHIIIESMQIGTPIITTNVGGNPELITNNKTGILVEYNNKEELKQAIMKIWQNKNLAKNLSQNTQAEIKNKFSQEKMIKEAVKVLS